ncbi:MAG: response regulator [bacterium]|nr:response regulator [bacterium]
MEGIPTGIDFLDAGADGFFRAKPYMAFGGSGSGKSIFGLQYAHAGLVAGENALYVCREKADDLIQQGERIGFPLGQYVDNDQLVLLEYDEGFREIVARSGPEAVLIELQAEVESLGIRRVILDPIDPFFSSMDDETILRSELRMLTSRFEEMGWSPLMLCDAGVMQQRFVLRVFSEICWGLFELQRGGESDSPDHSLLVYKMRNVQLEKSRFDFRIGESGISSGAAAPAGARRGFARFRRAEAPVTPPPVVVKPTPPSPPPPSPPVRKRAKPSPERAGEMDLLDDAALDEIERLARDRRTGDEVALEPPTPEARPALSATVLVIESDEDARRAMLHACGSKVEVVEAADGVSGLRVAAETCPDLIVMGARMPRLNGIGLCRILRESGVAVPVVMLCSSHAGPGEAPRSLAAGADAALPKPVDERSLRATMVSLLRERPPGSERWPKIDTEMAPRMLMPRNLAPEDLEAMIARVRSWAEDAGVPVSLVGYEFRFVEGSSNAFMEQFRDVLAECIRAEDFIADLGDRRLLALLVDADKEGAQAAIRRVHEEMANAAESFMGSHAVKPKALCRLLTLQPDRLADDAIEPPYVDRLYEEEAWLIEEDTNDRPGEPVEKYPLIEAVFHALSGEMALLTSPLDGEVHPISQGTDGVREAAVDGHRYRLQDEAEETPAGFRARSGARIVWVETLDDVPRVIARVEEGRVFRGKEA